MSSSTLRQRGGAAVAQASVEVAQIFSNLTRDQAITTVRLQAETRATAIGAATDSLKVVEMEHIPLSYLRGDARRARVCVVGDIASTWSKGTAFACPPERRSREE
ncbi:hypothetical protein [Rhodopila sp.]|uniref:hypothetical protein n=1 Tax=Rhodopila sp. TaxID=2480087 RepID=UPI003D0CFE0F